MCELKNTIKFTFSDGGNKPKIEEVVDFVKGLNADRSQILAVYRMEEKAIFIKWKSEESMLHALTSNPDEMIFHYANGTEAKVFMTHAQECVFYIRVYDLPPEIPDQELASVLGKYGRVKRVVREKFPVELGLDAFTGVRGAYMDVKKEIPTSLHFLNRKGNIVYPGNNSKCFLCKEEGHRMNACPKRKARNQQEKPRPEQEQSGSRSFAGAVIGGKVIGGPVIEGVQSNNNNQETIEMHEEGMSEAAMTPTVPPAEENNEDETSENVENPLYQLMSRITEELNKKNEEAKKKSYVGKLKKKKKLNSNRPLGRRRTLVYIRNSQ